MICCMAFFLQGERTTGAQGWDGKRDRDRLRRPDFSLLSLIRRLFALFTLIRPLLPLSSAAASDWCKIAGLLNFGLFV